jgi:hypothetical protein
MKLFLIILFVCIVETIVFAQKKCLTGDCEDGYGTATVKEDKVKYFYVGKFKNGEFNGYGELETESSDGKITYKGDFKDGKYHGNGTFRQESFSNLIKYNGEFKDGKFNGRGTYEIRDKKTNSYEIREGIFTDDQIFGFSKVFSDKFTYIGNLEKGVREGVGIIKYKDGSCYKGYFKNNKYDELGQINQNDEFICAGQVVDGISCTGMIMSRNSDGNYFFGFSDSIVVGKMVYVETDDYYIGFVEKDEKKGAGVLWSGGSGTFQSWNKVDSVYPEKFTFNRKDKNCLTGDCEKGLNVMTIDSIIHVGNFESFKPDGFGVQEHWNGKILYGMFDSVANLVDGFSILEYQGFTYFGYMVENKFSGKGMIIENSSETTYIGELLGLKPNGHGALIDYKNNIINYGMFEIGRYVPEPNKATEDVETINEIETTEDEELE